MTSEQSEGTQSSGASEPELNRYFRVAMKTQATDIHLKVGQPPKLRMQSSLRTTTGDVLTEEKMEELVFEILTPDQKKTFLETGTLDLGHNIADEGRFRINIFRQRGMISLAARRINTEILSFKELHLPAILAEMANPRQGLVLAVGPTGCGKTTTITSMVNYITLNRACHIITVEDPIEYLLKDNKALVSQREIGIDVKDFEDALKYVVRQDPDVIVISEMRDAATVTAGMRAAETGHLVFGTMHSANAAQAVERLLDLFPQEERNLIRQSLSLSLKAIVSQVLIPCLLDGIDRIPAIEILLANPSARKLIAEGRESELPTVIRSSEKEGMQDLTFCLADLIKNGSIEPREAYKYAPNVDELKMVMKGIRADTSGIL